MRIGIIGRTEILYETALQLHKQGNKIAHVITAKEAPEYTRTSEDFCRLAEELDVPFAHSTHIENETTLIQESQPDIGVSLNYTGIIPQSVIDCFPLGILNAHGGDLPRYRGNACQAWAILNGENRIGLCIHRMIGGELDSGDIIARDYFPINHTTKVTRCWEWMAERIPELFLDAVEGLRENPNTVIQRQSSNPKDSLRCYPRHPEDGRIDWSQSAMDVLRLVNASNKPYAGAFCVFEGEKMTIWDAEVVEDQENFCAIPGQVTRIGEGFVEVACVEGKLKVKEIEIGGEVGTPDSWVKSIRKRFK